MKQDQTVRAFDHDAASGGYQYTGYDHLSARLSNAHMSACIASSYPLANKRILDIGCGDGTYSFELKTRYGASSVFGLDPSAEAIRIAETRQRDQNIADCAFAALAIENFTPTQSFDVAILRGVLHHMDDPALAVRKALSAAPTIIILEPNGLNPILKFIERLSAYHRAHGERSYLPSTINRWITEAGGTTVTRRFITLVPFFCPDPAARLLHKLQPIAEALPLIRAFACGQYLTVATKSPPPRGEG